MGHNQYDYLLNKLIEMLPNVMKREWIMFVESSGRTKNMETFSDWISIQKRMAVQMVKPKGMDSLEEKERPRNQHSKRGTGNLRVTRSEEAKFKCPFCKKSNHANITKCWASSEEYVKLIISVNGFCKERENGMSILAA